MPFVDLTAQYESIKEEIDSAIHGCIDRAQFIGGSIIKDFEQDFAAFVGVSHCVGCANGTDAIEIALKAMGVGAGDEVLVPALTWISTAGAVNNVGAEPVFIDILEEERTIDPSSMEAKITSKTKAIIPVHLYGLPARMDEIMTIAKKHGLKVLEDCAQAHGATITGRSVGTFGDAATFSFYPGKNLGAYGDAGGIVTNNEELATTCRLLANHGQAKKHDHSIIGRNSRMDTLQAAILKAKIPHLDGWTEGRIAHAQSYRSKLDGVQLPVVPEGFRHIFHLFVIQSTERDVLKRKMDKAQIGYSIHYPNPLPFVGAYSYKGHEAGDFPIAEATCREILSIPMFSELTESQINKVVEVVNTARN